MTDGASGADDIATLTAYFHTVTIRENERSLCTRLGLRDELVDNAGALRIGAVAFAVDVATGIASGVAVLDRDMWVVTTDLDVHMTAPVTEGPLRVEVEVLRAGATTAVAAFSLYDEGRGRPVGGGSATSRPFPFTFDRSRLVFGIGEEFSSDNDGTTPTRPIAEQLGFQLGADGSVGVEIDSWLRNPWGILHGGVTACLVDTSGELAGSAALGGPVRVTSQLTRYLAPGRVGPVRGVPRLLAVDHGQALVEVRVVDEGADGRLIAVGTLTAIALAPK
jgi:uncharacterized protein (TIGR00369 family)